MEPVRGLRSVRSTRHGDPDRTNVCGGDSSSAGPEAGSVGAAMSRRPDRVHVPPAARYRIRFAKRGRARFASHRDFQRAFERALRRAGVPMAYSAGFSPHPKISYANAAATGAASEAEYVEIGTSAEVDPGRLADELDAALPHGFDIVEVVPALTSDFAARLQASQWRVDLPGVTPLQCRAAIAGLLDQDVVEVTRMTKKGPRTFDVRAELLSITCVDDEAEYAILHMVVRHGTPSVRPDDVLVGLRQAGNLATPLPPVVTRMAQGPLVEGTDEVRDPFEPDRQGSKPSAVETA